MSPAILTCLVMLGLPGPHRSQTWLWLYTWMIIKFIQFCTIALNLHWDIMDGSIYKMAFLGLLFTSASYTTLHTTHATVMCNTFLPLACLCWWAILQLSTSPEEIPLRGQHMSTFFIILVPDSFHQQYVPLSSWPLDSCSHKLSC